MIIDSSALLAILFDEGDAAIYAAAIANAETRKISAATLVEVCAAVESQAKSGASSQVDALLRRTHTAIEPVTVEQAHIARQAYSDFGMGRHSAGLNFGDCFSYALSKATGEPLLFKGKDFARTDIRSALRTSTA